MKKFLFSSFTSLALIPLVGKAVEQSYINFGVVESPQVNATNVINFGTISAFVVSQIEVGALSPFDVKPFETYSTLNYTNVGIFQGFPGFRFEHTPPEIGHRAMAANFVNENPGVVVAQDILYVFPPTLPYAPCGLTIEDPTYIIISATNIITRSATASSGSSLIVGPSGTMELTGHHVDLARSGLEVLPLGAASFGDVLFGNPPTNFVPDVAIYDRNWASASFSRTYPLSSAALWDGVSAGAPAVPRPPFLQPPANDPVPGPGFPGFRFAPLATDSYLYADVVPIPCTDSNGVEVIVNLLTNVFKGAVFVNAPPGFVPFIGFSGGGVGPREAGVLIQSGSDYISITDTLASSTNRGLSFNLLGCPTSTARPINYYFNRLPFSPGLPGNNGIPTNDFFLSTGVALTNPIVTVDRVTNATVEVGDFSAYVAFLDRVTSRPATVANTTVTNLTGRIRIKAGSLDLTETRITGQGQVQIEADHLISSVGADVDCANLSFKLASTNGLLKIENLVKDQVVRFNGDVRLWSAFWTNQVRVFIDNYTNNEGVLEPAPITNLVAVAYHALMVDVTPVATTTPVRAYDFLTRSTHTIISDNVRVGERMIIEGDSLEITGGVDIPGTVDIDPITLRVLPGYVPLRDWTAANSPSLRFLTNSGSINVISQARFGDDRATPYLAFVNFGDINAAGLAIRSGYFENLGVMLSGGPLFIQSDLGIFDGGTSSAGTEARLVGGSFKFTDHTLTSAGALVLDVANEITDGGPGANNFISVLSGFQLRTKPKVGDLLGTTLESGASPVPSILVNHVWAGEDRGATAAGYTDNVAIGILRLTASSLNPVFRFTGAGARNGLYVDFLDLITLTSLSNQLQILPSLTIYYAAVSTSFVPPPWPDTGQPRTPEEYLDGAFGGRLRWVPTYAGANSSQVVIINGQPTPVNRALVNSTKIDSDDDGIPNVADTDPFASTPVDPVLPLADYTAASATYNGLFVTAGGVEVDNSGAITIKTTANGSFTGNLRQGGKRYSFKGQFSETGGSTNVVTRSGATSLTVVLQVNTPENSMISGTVTDGNWTAQLHTDRAAFNARSNPAPFAGRYTMAFPGPGTANDPLLPAGQGFGTVTVSTAGKVKFSGTLADGTKVSQSTTVAADGHWPVFVPLYRGNGELLGWFTFVNGVAEDITGEAAWIKPADAKSKYYPAGFNESIFVTGSTYTPSLSPVTVFTAGVVTMIGGNLGDMLKQNADIVANNRATVTGGGKLTIIGKTGLIRGSLINPTTGKPVKFQGAIVQQQGEARGYFLGTSQSGEVSLRPR